MEGIEKVNELVRKYQEGFCSALELFSKVVHASTQENCVAVLNELPEGICGRFRKWVMEFDLDDYYSISEGDVEPLPVDVMQAFKDTVSAAGGSGS